MNPCGLRIKTIEASTLLEYQESRRAFITTRNPCFLTVSSLISCYHKASLYRKTERPETFSVLHSNIALRPVTDWLSVNVSIRMA